MLKVRVSSPPPIAGRKLAWLGEVLAERSVLQRQIVTATPQLSFTPPVASR